MKVISVSGLPGAGKDTFYRYLAVNYPNIALAKFATPLQDMVALIGSFYEEDLSHRKLYENHNWKDNALVSMAWADRPQKVHDLTLSLVSILLGEEPKPATNTHKYPWTFIGNKLVLAHDLNLDVVQFLKYYEIASFSPREWMKKLGEYLRGYYSTIWVDLLLDYLTVKVSDSKLVVVTDTRYPNEFQALANLSSSCSVYIVNDKATREAEDAGLLNHSSEDHHRYLFSNATYRLYNNSTLEDFYAEVDRVYQTFAVGE